jgi:hypothetical protein
MRALHANLCDNKCGGCLHVSNCTFSVALEYYLSYSIHVQVVSSFVALITAMSTIPHISPAHHDFYGPLRPSHILIHDPPASAFKQSFLNDMLDFPDNLQFSSTVKKSDSMGRGWGYWHSDQNPCRGWGCTHICPIHTVSTGRGWGYWHTWYINWPVNIEPGWDRPYSGPAMGGPKFD